MCSVRRSAIARLSEARLVGVWDTIILSINKLKPVYADYGPVRMRIFRMKPVCRITVAKLQITPRSNFDHSLNFRFCLGRWSVGITPRSNFSSTFCAVILYCNYLLLFLKS